MSGNTHIETVSKRTRYSFGYGCIGRDACYTLVSSFIMTYLTLAVGLADWQLVAVGFIMVAARIWDAINDPMMGFIVDNTRSRWGKFKPYILAGALLNSIFTVLLFCNFGFGDVLFLVMFGITYIMWGMTYTVNDISYWSMLPTLTVNQQEREKVSSLARIGANIGLFAITALVPIVTQMGRMSDMYLLLSIVVAVLFVACQILVVVGVQEGSDPIIQDKAAKIRLRDILTIVFKNDQLVALIGCILLFNIGYYVTTGFGVQFFYFDYGVYGGMEFTIFALTIGVAQILTLMLYPTLSKGRTRRQMFSIAIGMILIAYVGFMLVGYVLPMNMPMLCVIGFVLFSGQAIIQLLNYVMLADTVEYGQWKLGSRNESVIFSVNPFMTKLAGAIQAGVFAVTLAVSGLNRYSSAISELENDPFLTKTEINVQANALVQTISQSSKLMLRASMIVLPLLLIVTSYLIYMKFYNIDEQRYAQIITDLEQRAQEEKK
jgi:melibiose permease/lactose/raffinose/galactose permease